jgi:O-acetyl-ADP-ribose deacetylase (regulator of RNase III)
MIIIFCDINKENLDALRTTFGKLPNFEFVQNNINSIQADCVVSPANSYGLMDGGVDRIINYSLNFISEKVKDIIQFRYKGEQPVGTCIIIPIEQGQMIVGKYKYLAHTPTMRVPKDVSNTDNAYIAFRALLTELIDHNCKYKDINTVVMTSFCCGAGKMSSLQSAKQMRFAYDCVIGNTQCNWNTANNIDKMLDLINKNN